VGKVKIKVVIQNTSISALIIVEEMAIFLKSEVLLRKEGIKNKKAKFTNAKIFVDPYMKVLFNPLPKMGNIFDILKYSYEKINKKSKLKIT